MATKKLPTKEQIEIALDGRTQRWLALEVKIAESELSKKLRNSELFTQDEIDRINKRLNSNVILITNK